MHTIIQYIRTGLDLQIQSKSGVFAPLDAPQKGQKKRWAKNPDKAKTQIQKEKQLG